MDSSNFIEENGPNNETLNRLIEAIRDSDRAAAAEIIDRWLLENDFDKLFADVLDPVMVIVGNEWSNCETFTIAQAYVAGKIVEDAYTKVSELFTARRGELPLTKGPVILGNIEDDFHSLGRRMITTFLQFNGWKVHDLGNDVSAKEFVDKAVETNSKVIGVSALTLSTARNIRRVREEIDQRGLHGQIQLAVGGAVFLVHPELCNEIGGDGTARNAMESVRLFDELWKKATKEQVVYA